MLKAFKARYPKLFPVVAAMVALGAVSGAAAYEVRSRSCCAVGAACCYPGSPCCANHGKHGTHADAPKAM